jgi:3-isopropylmalate dehydrogenase
LLEFFATSRALPESGKRGNPTPSVSKICGMVRQMGSQNLLLLPGDGIGPEIMVEVKKVIAWFNAKGGMAFETDEGLVGGSAYDAHGQSISEGDMAKAMAADAVIFGAVGGPKWDGVDYDKFAPKPACCACARTWQLFANLRPAICYPALADASSLKKERD